MLIRTVWRAPRQEYGACHTFNPCHGFPVGDSCNLDSDCRFAPPEGSRRRRRRRRRPRSRLCALRLESESGAIGNSGIVREWCQGRNGPCARAKPVFAGRAPGFYDSRTDKSRTRHPGGALRRLCGSDSGRHLTE